MNKYVHSFISTDPHENLVCLQWLNWKYSCFEDSFSCWFDQNILTVRCFWRLWAFRPPLRAQWPYKKCLEPPFHVGWKGPFPLQQQSLWPWIDFPRALVPLQTQYYLGLLQSELRTAPVLCSTCGGSNKWRCVQMFLNITLIKNILMQKWFNRAEQSRYSLFVLFS